MSPTSIPEPVSLDRNEKSRRASNRKAIKIVLAVMAVGLLLQVWSVGTFDNFLWRVGLNAKPCATNGFGATFCGDALKEYNKRIKTP